MIGSRRPGERAGTLIVRGGRIVYASEGVAALAGRTVEELVGRPFEEFVHHEERAAVLDRYERRFRGEPIPDSYETTLSLPGGARGRVEVHVESDGADVLVHLRDAAAREARRLRLEAVAALGATIQAELEEERIHAHVRDELAALGLSSSLARSEAEGLRVIWSTAPAGVPERFRALSGVPFEGYLVPWTPFTRRVWAEGWAFSEDWALESSRFVPEAAREAYREIVRAAGGDEGDPGAGGPARRGRVRPRRGGRLAPHGRRARAAPVRRADRGGARRRADHRGSLPAQRRPRRPEPGGGPGERGAGTSTPSSAGRRRCSATPPGAPASPRSPSTSAPATSCSPRARGCRPTSRCASSGCPSPARGPARCASASRRSSRGRSRRRPARLPGGGLRPARRARQGDRPARLRVPCAGGGGAPARGPPLRRRPAPRRGDGVAGAPLRPAPAPRRAPHRHRRRPDRLVLARSRGGARGGRRAPQGHPGGRRVQHPPRGPAGEGAAARGEPRRAGRAGPRPARGPLAPPRGARGARPRHRLRGPRGARSRGPGGAAPRAERAGGRRARGGRRGRAGVHGGRAHPRDGHREPARGGGGQRAALPGDPPPRRGARRSSTRWGARSSATLDIARILDAGVRSIARIVDAPDAYLALEEGGGLRCARSPAPTPSTSARAVLARPARENLLCLVFRRASRS